MSKLISDRFQIGEWRVRPQEGAMEVLVYSVRNSGEIVDNDELVDHIWAPSVVSDATVEGVVSELRKAFGDDPKHPKYIARVPKRGYRIVASVTAQSEATRFDERSNTEPFSETSRNPILAVLPLANLSGNPELEHVADGMTAELIGELGKLPGLTVISWTSVMRYKVDRGSLPAIASELGADLIIEGIATREGDQFRVNLELIDAHSDTVLWSNRFDRSGSSVLALRNDVAHAVAEELQLNLAADADQSDRGSETGR